MRYEKLRASLVGLSLAAAALGPAAAGTTTVVESFDGGGNEGGWTWGFGDTIAATGGNPGAYLHTDGLDTFAPRPQTTSGGAFIGDYRARGVLNVGVDLITFHVDFSAEGRALTLMLIHDNDTPDDPFDDTAAYFLGENIPLEGQGWKIYDFDVPSQETSLPAGWQLLNLGDSGAPPIHDWNDVIQHVSAVWFHYGDPTLLYIFQQWSLGLDNPRITTGTSGEPGDEQHVTICHHPPDYPESARTIIVGASAVPAHLAHGDTPGSCTTAESTDGAMPAQPVWRPQEDPSSGSS
jgi:hypothetical protein